MKKLEVIKINDIVLKKILKELIIKGKGPMGDSYIIFFCKETIFLLQEHIFELTKLGKLNDAKKLIEKFSFSVITRLGSIYLLTSKVSLSIKDKGKFIIKFDKDYLQLLKSTNYVVINETSIIQRIRLKKDESFGTVDINNLIDLVLQKSMVILIEPYYAGLFHNEIFGFRQGHNKYQAVLLLWRCISTKQDCKNIISINLKGCFDSIDINVLKNIGVPSKFRKLTDLGLLLRMKKRSNDYLFIESDVSQGFIMESLFINIVFNGLKEYIFNDYSKFFYRTVLNKKFKVYNHCIMYVDRIMIISNNFEINYILKKVKEYLYIQGLELNQGKFGFFNFSEQKKNFKFIYINLKFFFILINNFKIELGLQKGINTKLKSHINEIYKILILVDDKIFKTFKDKLKTIIRSSYNLSIYLLINKLNAVIRGFSNYFNLAQNYRYLSGLDYFVHKRLMIGAKKKFKKISVKCIVGNLFLDRYSKCTLKFKNLKNHIALKNFITYFFLLLI